MKNKNVSALVLSISLFATPVDILAQGQFHNLNFEDAMIVPISGQEIQFGAAFPGWIGYFGQTLATSALYNAVSLNGISDFALLTTNSSLSVFPLAGRYSAVLQSANLAAAADVSLAQTGTVPSDALSLRFLALNSPNPFLLTLNGQQISTVILQDFGSYREYGAEISAFAGQTAELRFTQFHGPTMWGNLGLDNISFSPVPIPEPGTWALLGLGSALFGCVARRRN